MSSLRLCLLLAVICSCSQYGLAGLTKPETVTVTVKPPLEPETVPEAVLSEATAAPPAPVPSSMPTSTAESNPPPTTTKNTTTSTTTTTTTTTSTTTPKPTPPPTPAPAPGPLPPPDQGTWFFKDSNVTCIVAQFAAQLNVTYTKAVNNATSLWYVVLNVPANATVVDGNCTAADQWIQVSWWNTNTSIVANNMTLVYHRNETTKNYGLKSLNVSLSPENFVNSSSNDPMDLYHGAEWQTPLATSYRCKTATVLNMTAENANAGVLTLSKLQEEAYRTTNGSGFSAARECGGGDVPDAVPIAVGCALGGLVLVVLVAYLVGRRRSAARGYLSM